MMLTQLLTAGGDDEATEGFVMFVMNRLNTFLSNLLSCPKVHKKKLINHTVISKFEWVISG